MPLVWFITGASSGFGRAIAAAAAERGDRVIATARRAETLGDLVERYPDRVRTVTVDVTDPGSVRAAVELAAAGGGRIDVVVNNAGYAALGALEELTEDQVRRQVEVNLFGVLTVTRSMARSAPWPDYAESVGRTRAFMETFTRQPGDPERAAQAILTVVDDDKPPLRLPLGAYAVAEFRAEYRSRLAEIDAWEEPAHGADYPIETP